MGAIYLRQGDEFVAMHERPYEAEAVLQVLLADHPGILAGGEPGEEGHGWVLVKREAGVGDVERADSWNRATGTSLLGCHALAPDSLRSRG